MKREVLHSKGDPAWGKASLEKLWEGLGSQIPGKTCLLGVSPSWWPVDVEEMGKEIERGWRYQGMGQRGLLHISLVKTLSLLFGFDMRFDLIITYLCVSGWRELCDELPLSRHQVKKIHLKHHATLWVMPLYVYRREDISISLMRSLDQSIPAHLQTYEMVYPGKRPSCNSLYLHHPWPKATQAAGEQGTH